MATPAELYFNRERRRGRQDPAFQLFRTRALAVGEAIVPADLWGTREQPITFSSKVRVTGASPAGMVIESGGTGSGHGIWLESSGIGACAGSGALANPGSVTVNYAPAGGLAVGGLYWIVHSILPGSGQAALWINGRLADLQQAADGVLTSWTGTGGGGVGIAGSSPSANVPVGSQGAPSDFDLVSPVSYYLSQIPRQFPRLTS